MRRGLLALTRVRPGPQATPGVGHWRHARGRIACRAVCAACVPVHACAIRTFAFGRPTAMADATCTSRPGLFYGARLVALDDARSNKSRQVPVYSVKPFVVETAPFLAR
eukprot:2214670-Prymnesium_polylepis.2